MKYIGIVGSRRRNGEEDYLKTEKEFLEVYKENDIIVSGGCPKGGDRFAEVIAKKFEITILIYYPKWSKYGRSAGFKRNSKIAAKSDILIACVSSDRTGGTENTIKKFKSRKIEFRGKLIIVEN